MRALKTELAIFESCLDGFWSRLLAEGSPGVTGARLALEFSDEAMKEHQKVVARLSKSNGGLFSSLRMVLKKRFRGETCTDLGKGQIADNGEHEYARRPIVALSPEQH
jgi:hypothetical protein